MKVLPTVRAILQLPVFQASDPYLLSGTDRLDSPVRWVHVSEVLEISGLLSGGELVLTTGSEFEKTPESALPFLKSLEESGAAGLVVELFSERQRSLTALEHAATQCDLPLIVLKKRVKFVEITEVVHRMIVAEQLELVERARDVHEVFTVLSLESAGTQEVVEQAATMIGAPVVLEDLSHLVLSYSTQGLATTEVLDDWERKSRTTQTLASTGRAGSTEWLQTPVGIRGQLWGRLVVPMPLGDDESATIVLERAAQTLAINRLAERDQRELSKQAQAGLLNALRQPRGLREAEALARAAALGLRRTRHYLPLVFRRSISPLEGQQGVGLSNDPLATQQEERALLDRLGSIVRSAAGSALTASIRPGAVGMLLGLGTRQQEDAMLGRISEMLSADVENGEAAWVIGVGRLRESLLEAAASMDEAAHVAETAATLKTASKAYYRATDIRLRGLLALLRNDPRVQQFVESELEGVLRAEAEGSGGHLELLTHYLESGGNKAAMSRSGYLSRPTLYSRLAKLEDLLSVDLDDAESRTSLHVAIILHKLRSSDSPPNRGGS